MGSKLYHCDVYMPKSFIEQCIEHQHNLSNFRFSKHLNDYFISSDVKHRLNKGWVVRCLLSLKANAVAPFEVEVEDGEVVKYAIRMPYNLDKDISIVILIKSRLGGTLIKTAWLNYQNDLHKTLVASKYVTKN